MKIASLLGSVLAALVVAFAARSVSAQEAMRVAIPLFPTVAFPVLVGADKGFFHKGLIIEPIRINSAPTTYQALISGDVHAVVGARPPAYFRAIYRERILFPWAVGTTLYRTFG